MQSIRRVYISVLSLIVFMFIFGTATFAWLSINAINSIDGLSLSATAGDELQISVDGITYSQFLNTEQLEDIFGNIKLIDVTTMDGQNFITGGLRDVEEAIPNEHYLSFDLWFRSIQAERHIYLSNNVNELVTFDSTANGTYVVSRGTTWIAKYDFLNGPSSDDIVKRGNEGIYYGSEAIRIAVIELLNEQNELDQRDASSFKSIIYDPSENPERGYGLYYGAFNYFMASSGYTSFRLPTTKPITIYQLTQFAQFDPYQALDNVSLVAELVPNGEVDEEGNPYYIGKIRINVWIEGWDADAFDAISKDRIKMQLQFKAGKPYQDLG